MQLGALLTAAGPAFEAVVEGPPLDAAAAEVEISSVTHDSREVGPGALFCCVRGQRADGHQHGLRGDGGDGGDAARPRARRQQHDDPPPPAHRTSWLPALADRC